MATEKLVQTSFVNGQYDREVQSKERSDFIGQGLSKALNVVSSEKGELRKRLGTRHLQNLVGASVLVPFRKPDGDDIVLACTDGNIKGYEFKGDNLVELAVPTGVAPTFPTSGWSSDTNGDYTVTLSDSTNYGGFNTVAFPYDSGSQYPNLPTSDSTTTIQIQSSSAQLLSKLTVRWAFYAFGDRPDWFCGWLDPVIQYSDDGSSWVSIQTNVINPGYGNDPEVGYDHQRYASGHFWKTTNSLVMDIQNPGHTTPHEYWRILFRRSIYTVDNDPNVNSETLHLVVSDVTYVSTTTTAFDENNSFFSAGLLKNIKYSQHYTQMIMACAGKDPIQLGYLAGALTLTSYTAVTTWGQPTCVQHFQNRLWFGGFTSLPTSVLASKIDDYTDFTEHTPLQFDDYLNLKCNQLRTEITNIIGGQKVLYAFSEDGLSLVDSGSNGMIATNQSIEFNLRNRMPAGDATPAYKDDIMLYGSSDGTKLYAVDYDLITERFQVDDLAKYAKDITFAKITELHYVNDESKLIYGLLETGNMFALNYKKGVYQGFFPIRIQDGYIYDIVQIKLGRNYKLLLVTNRNNNWYIEELPDKGVYVDTTAPFMTKEDKKWATYDNINNNIALDCHQDYANMVSIDANIDYENSTLSAQTNLSSYVGSQVMFGQLNDSDKWVIADIDSESSALYGWYGSVTCWTESATPAVDDPVYNANGEEMSYKVTGYLADDGYGNETLSIISTVGIGGVYPSYTLHRSNSNDRYVYAIIIDAQRGATTSFDTLYQGFTTLPVNLPVNSNIGVVSQGKYLGEYVVDSGQVTLPETVFKATYGALYDAYAFIKIERPYESMKTVRQINLEVQNTMHLSVGTSLDDMQVLEDINDNTHYDLTNMTMNGGYVIVPGDTPEWSKFIIMKSDKGLPFTVNAIEVIINYSNEGGN